jgi:tetratricopeptide (TPR) repeat protein
MMFVVKGTSIPCVLAAAIIGLAGCAAMSPEAQTCAGGTTEASVAACTQLLQAGDLSPRMQAITLYNRGTSYEGAGQYALAIADFSEAIRLKPDYANAFLNRGGSYVGEGRYDLAIADLNDAIRLDPDLYDAYVDRGSAYENNGQYEPALADFNDAIRLKPDSAEAFLDRGGVYAHTRRLDLALADFNKALLLRPAFPEAYVNRASVNAAKGQFDLAIADYNVAIRLRPGYVNAIRGRGDTHAEMGQYDVAIADYDDALRVRADARVLNARCWARAIVGKELDKALADCNAALGLAPDSVAVMDSLGFVKLQMGRFKDAIADYTAALEKHPLASSYFGRGIAKLKSGDRTGGNADIEEAKRIDPGITSSFARFGVIP